MDPRVLKEGVTEADVRDQVELSLKVRDALSSARQTASRLEKTRESLAEEEERRRALDNVHKQLVTAPIRYSRPMLIDQLTYLYENLYRADQRPSQDAYRRYEKLHRELEGHISRLDQLQSPEQGKGTRR